MRRIACVLILLLCPIAWSQAAVPCVQQKVTNARVTQHEFDALVDFVFNVGCHAFGRSQLLRKVNLGDEAGAANEFMKWIYVNGRPVPGLIRRRTDERNLFLKP